MKWNNSYFKCRTQKRRSAFLGCKYRRRGKESNGNVKREKKFRFLVGARKKKLKESFDLSVPFTLREYIPAIEEIIRCVFSFHYIFCISLQKNAKNFGKLNSRKEQTQTKEKKKNFYRKTSLPSIAWEIKKKFPFCICWNVFSLKAFSTSENFSWNLLENFLSC